MLIVSVVEPSELVISVRDDSFKPDDPEGGIKSIFIAELFPPNALQLNEAVRVSLYSTVTSFTDSIAGTGWYCINDNNLSSKHHYSCVILHTEFFHSPTAKVIGEAVNTD